MIWLATALGFLAGSLYGTAMTIWLIRRDRRKEAAP